MNAPPPDYEFVLKDGEKKVEYNKDTKIENAATFVLRKEDHTIGNLLRMQLLRDSEVLFAGYKVPHPLEANVELKIQTTNKTKPVASLLVAIEDLIDELDCLKERFEDALNSKQTTEFTGGDYL